MSCFSVSVALYYVIQHKKFTECELTMKSSVTMALIMLGLDQLVIEYLITFLSHLHTAVNPVML